MEQAPKPGQQEVSPKEAPNKGWLQKLQERWQLKSLWQVVVVLIVFACTGFSVLFIKKPLFELAGINENTPAWWRTTFYLITILPAYQVLLLLYGTLLGQFKFFWFFEKKMFLGIARLFGYRPKKSPNQ